MYVRFYATCYLKAAVGAKATCHSGSWFFFMQQLYISLLYMNLSNTGGGRFCPFPYVAMLVHCTTTSKDVIKCKLLNYTEKVTMGTS